MKIYNGDLLYSENEYLYIQISIMNKKKKKKELF